MKHNIGDVDRMLRLGVGLNRPGRSNARLRGLIGIILLASAAIDCCPVYPAFCIRSCATKE